MDNKFVSSDYIKENGLEDFFNYLTDDNTRDINAISVKDFVRKNIEYNQKRKNWNFKKFIGLSGLINFTGGIEHLKEIALNEFGYLIEFIENEANILHYPYENDVIAVNKVEYTKVAFIGDKVSIRFYDSFDMKYEPKIEKRNIYNQTGELLVDGSVRVDNKGVINDMIIEKEQIKDYEIFISMEVGAVPCVPILPKPKNRILVTKFEEMKDCYIILSGYYKKDSESAYPLVSFFYNGKDYGVEWCPPHGDIVKYEKGTIEDNNGEEHFFYDYIKGKDSSPLAIDDEHLARKFVYGDYKGIFKSLKNYA